MSYSDFITAVDAGKVASVTIQGNDVAGKFTDGKDFRTYKPADALLSEKLLENKVAISARPEEEKFSWFSIFISWFPLILLVGVWIFFMRQMQVGGRQGDGLRQKPRQTPHRGPGEDHLRGCGGGG